MAFNFERINRELGRTEKREEELEDESVCKEQDDEIQEGKMQVVRMDIKQFREEWKAERIKQQEEMERLNQRLKEMQEAIEKNKLGRPSIYKKQEAEMKKDFENGLSYRELAKKYRCSVSTVYKYVNM